jgi:NitT/TauT family transport system ATP-binding protein
VPKGDRERRARDWLRRVGLARFVDYYPHQLSGGQQKRVSIAATLVYEPRLLLMDEPFAALDVQTRDLVERDILNIWQESRQQTVLFVTHDLEEAIALSDRVTVMSASPGRILETFAVELPRPRDLEQVRFEDGFQRLHREIWGRLRSEVQKTAKRDFDSDVATGAK